MKTALFAAPPHGMLLDPLPRSDKTSPEFDLKWHDLEEPMATVSFLRSFGDDWPPDALVDGSIKTRSATEMTYISDLGYRVTWFGTGLTYDENGFGAGGTVDRVLVAKDGFIKADFQGLDTAMQRMSMFAFGFEREPYFSAITSDADGLYEYMMRKADVITGTSAEDEINGGDGNDSISGLGGDDFFDIDAGDDTIDGGNGWDILTFRNANWVYSGAQGINLNVAAKTMTDAWGNHDVVQGFEEFRDSALNDTLIGSADGEDFYLSRGTDYVDGGGGFDIVNFSRADNWGGTKGVVVDLSTGIARDSWDALDRLVNIHTIVDTIFNDTIKGSAATDNFFALSGKDFYDGRGGTDALSFDEIDTIGGSHGVVVDMNFTKGEIRDDGFGNKENISNIEVLGGSSYGDKFTGGAGMDDFSGLQGNDTLLGGKGDDSLTGGYGRDVLKGGAGTDVLIGGLGFDTLTGGGGEDSFRFHKALRHNGVDRITDFVSGTDDLILWSNWMSGHTALHLEVNQFRSGAGVIAASTANHRVIYNSTTGDLYFDKDGTGAAAAVKFAVLEGSPTLNFLDIWTI